MKKSYHKLKNFAAEQHIYAPTLKKIVQRFLETGKYQY